MKCKNITGAGFILLNFDNLNNEWKMLCLIDKDGLLDLPKGTIDNGEDILIAAQRELFEETNIDIGNEKIFKTWINWDEEWEKDKKECLDKFVINVQGSNKLDCLKLFFCEVEESILEDIKILPNPYTNKKEHINYKFINKYEFESENTPEYLLNCFEKVLKKIRIFGETRGFEYE